MEVHSLKRAYGVLFFFHFSEKDESRQRSSKILQIPVITFSFLSLCFGGLHHQCGCKFPLLPPLFLGAAATSAST